MTTLVAYVNKVPVHYDPQTSKYHLGVAVWPINRARFDTFHQAMVYIYNRLRG